MVLADMYTYSILGARVPVVDPETLGRGGARNMKYKPPHLAAIFFGLFLIGRGSHGPLPLSWIHYWVHLFWISVNVSFGFQSQSGLPYLHSRKTA